VVGGLGSIGGAALASILIGLLHAFGVWLAPKSALVLAFVAMALVLIVRPFGLLGRAEVLTHVQAAAHAPFRPASTVLKWIAWIALAVAASAPLWAGEYLLVILTEMAILAVFAASLHLFMGQGGITSFGHAAFFGLGAYGAALLTKHLGTSIFLGVVAGPLLALLGAIIAGWFVLRAQGVYAAMLTLAFAQILWSTAVQWVGVTGGDNGVLGLWPPAFIASKSAYFLFTLLLAAASLVLLRRAALSPFGFALRASRDASDRATASGIDALRVQWFAFAAGGMFAGLAGVLNAYQKGSVFPNALAIPQSLDALVMVLLGGLQTLAGPIVGAISYHALTVELTRTTEHWRLALGLAIVILVLAFPQGVAGFLRSRFEKSA
jgi:branched-chain amino acid transport system permease protein